MDSSRPAGGEGGLCIHQRGHPRLESMQVSRISPREIEQDIDDSLRALGLDTVDLYWLHRDDLRQRFHSRGKDSTFWCVQLAGGSGSCKPIAMRRSMGWRPLSRPRSSGV